MCQFNTQARMVLQRFRKADHLELRNIQSGILEGNALQRAGLDVRLQVCNLEYHANQRTHKRHEIQNQTIALHQITRSAAMNL